MGDQMTWRVEEEIFAEEAAERLGLKIECPPDEPVTGMRIMAAMEAEIARLRLVIRRLAEQDATLSVQGGNVTVTIDASLTDAEREALWALASHHLDDATFGKFAKTLCNLFERTNVTEYPRSKLLPTVMPDQLDAVIDGLERIKTLEAEIARLRLTDAEREAVAYYIGTGGPDGVDATLRELLARLK